MGEVSGSCFCSLRPGRMCMCNLNVCPCGGGLLLQWMCGATQIHPCDRAEECVRSSHAHTQIQLLLGVTQFKLAMPHL